jgi:hypothetical protein
MKQPSIYQQAVNMDIRMDNHCNDLYLIDCKNTQLLIKDNNLVNSVNASRFVSQIDGRYWYEFPFQYEPYNRK